MQRKGRILMVTRNFPPLVGGMERLLEHTFRALARAYEVALVGPEGCGDFAEPVFGACPPKPLPRFLACCALKTRRAVQSFRPDLIFCGSGLTVLPARWAAPGIPIVVYVHGLDLVAEHWLYQRLFVPQIRACARVLTNSHYTSACAQARGVAADRIRIVAPGVALPARVPNRESARQALGLPATIPVLLSVGRLTPRKGIYEFVEHVLPSIRRSFPEAVLLIVGDDPSAAVASEGRSAALTALTQRLGLDAAVHRLGRVDEQVLSYAYAASDLHVFPVQERKGDVEGFGMVALEAAAQGVPTVAFRSGGVPDAVSPGQSGWLIPPGDYTAFLECVLAYLGGSGSRPGSEGCRAFAAEHSWETFGACVRAICAEASPALSP